MAFSIHCESMWVSLEQESYCWDLYQGSCFLEAPTWTRDLPGIMEHQSRKGPSSYAAHARATK